ncbi:MAG: circadian clock KaiB family protein, partial [Candidatus Competibacterales bacterium]|nr:circadian clock KaiB family protein [Candidatus Competibacterales bacterium]
MRLRLYTAGNTPNSDRARHNLQQALARLSQPPAELEIIDVFREPQRALEDDIPAVPALLRVERDSRRVLSGRLHSVSL